LLIAPKRVRAVAAVILTSVMARPSKQDPVVTSIVPAVARHAASAGLDVRQLALSFELPADVAAVDELLAPAEAPEDLLGAVARAARRPEVALRVATELTTRAHGLLHLLVRAAPAVHDGLEWLAKAVPWLHEGLAARVDDAGRLVLTSPHRPRGVGRHVHELTLAHALHRLRDATPSATTRRVWFVHARPTDLGPLTAFFGTDDVAFGCEDSGFELDPSCARAPSPRADAATVQALAPLVEAEMARRTVDVSFADRVTARISAALPAPADTARVARELHMSARTLQRRLEQEGTSFTTLVDVARLARSRELLADRARSLTEIAFDLGFADLATFSRAFKRWTGVPPGQWRRS
jgi:AraC-like DNA-binding protein